MAKKQYRKAKTVSTTDKTTATVLNSPKNRLSSTDFNPDYSYVVKDLKRIGILAGSFIGVLIVLTFFLR
ncbi:MAG: hypothetical protein CVU40_07410 [Chloroflexi bacterium HGW-Chloroflexi-2]|jgi:hypothetical protein|nr:MAG: hypothetical protein CVU40_07410 [Chloroflexi bacterium HGW-Chloroflexi-2]